MFGSKNRKVEGKKKGKKVKFWEKLGYNAEKLKQKVTVTTEEPRTGEQHFAERSFLHRRLLFHPANDSFH